MNQIDSPSPKPSKSSLSPLLNSSTQSEYKKYLKHFQSINTPVKIPPAFIRNVQSNKSKYGAAISLYASSVSASIIDQIADSPVKQSQVKVDQSQLQDFVYSPIVGNFNPRIKERVMQINRFFGNGRKQEENVHAGTYDDGNLNGYILNIINIDLKNAITRPSDQSPIRKVSRSRSKQSVRPIVNRPPPMASPLPKTQQKQKPHQVHEVEVNTDPQPQYISHSPAKLKKIDLLLIQIMKQKKRKGLVPDYFRAIQMKLVQLLEYILQDQPQYFGLSLKDKMKEVLSNLEGFKGKTVDGQSKVNMLRIFFQQFRTLKKQKDQEAEGRQHHKSKSNSKKSNSKPQSKNSVVMIQVNQNYTLKSKKNFDTQSMGGSHPQQKLPPKKKPSQTKSVKQEDQWIGTLDN